MAFNNTGSNLYDNQGMCEGMLLTPNNPGTQLYDNQGEAESGLGTSTSIRLLASCGVGI